ncbi:MAG: PAS domain S-box protein [Enhydrobacter sp.]|nr:MAG: PAS domain S-box protein [Enhydrobacter sp.]
MSTVPSRVSGPAAVSKLAQLADLVRSFPSQVRLALGVRGVALATAAGVVGLLSCIVSFADIALSLHHTDLDRKRRQAAEILALDNTNRLLMRTIFGMSSGRVPVPAGEAAPVLEVWQQFQQSMMSVCRTAAGPVPQRERLQKACADPQALFARLTPDIEALDPPRRLLDPATVRELLAIRDDINALAVGVAQDADSMVGKLIDDYGRALFVLTLSTTGFVGAGLVLILLVGRASVDHHRLWLSAQQARDMVDRERTRYRRLVDSLSDTVYTVDRNGVLTFASAAVHELLGMPADRIVGRKLREFVDAADVERALAEARAQFQSQDVGVRQVHLRLRRANGAERHVEIRSRKPAGDEGTDVALVGIIHDVTERVDLAERLQRQMAEAEAARNDYQSLVDSVSDAVFKADAKSAVITFASAATAEVMGMPPAEIVGTRTFDQIHADDVEYVMSATKAALQGNTPRVEQLQYRIRTPAGETKHVETRFRKTPGPDGRSLVVGVVRDVEERVRMARRLEDEMARLRSIVESSGAQILMVDRELNVVMVNSGFTAMTGLGEADAIGRHLKKVVDCRLDPKVLDDWLAAPRHGRPVAPAHYSNQIRDPQGRLRLVSVTATPVVDAHGLVSNIVFLGVDDTERREAEQALFAVERLSTVGEMAATMAHEINQPLQVINLACESAKDEIDAAELRGTVPTPGFLRAKLERIGQQIDRASRIVGELRAFVRGTGSEESERPFEAVEAVRAAIELMAVPLLRQGAQVSLTRADAPSLVMGHFGKLEQVLVNLINNARDAGARSIDVSVSAVAGEGPHRFVAIAIDDDGRGIAADVLPRLFVDFVTTKERGKGTGFGLRICRRIVEEMGGTITARNRDARGACFEIVLPAMA